MATAKRKKPAATEGVPPGKMAVFALTENFRLEICCGDLSQEKVDCIVNPSTDHLKQRAGLALALSKAAGPKLQVSSKHPLSIAHFILLEDRV